MTDIIKVKTSVIYSITADMDLDQWEDYGYESKEHMRAVCLDSGAVKDDYWDITNGFHGVPEITVELVE
jgi:hypothetical protein